MRTSKMNFPIHSEETPLFVRAGLPRTFWSLGVFVEASLLFCGLYLLAEVGLRPLEADQVSILAAGLILGLAMVLFVYLVRPWRKAALARMEDSRQAALLEDKPLTVFGEAIRTRKEAERILEQTENLPGPM